MKRQINTILLAMSLLLATTSTMAIPAKPGQWRSLKLADGTEVRAELRGDEFYHYWQSADGVRYIQQGDIFTPLDTEAQTAAARKRARAHGVRHARKASPSRNYSGQKRGIIILVEFADTEFQPSNTQELYRRIANEEGFTSELGFVGSAYDYFKAQSNGQFELKFDVVGPVAMDKDAAYYGKDVAYPGDKEVTEGNDAHAGEMVAKACQAVADSVDFSLYDWDGDGEADQVMVIYAGKGQADGGSSNTIWPHEYQLQYSDYGRTLNLNGTRVDTYAVANEIQGNGTIEGIGTLCHEFSHCLGLMDMYDLNYDNFGMGSWSIMDVGSYNGDGFCPAGYSSFDKLSCGWLTPVELTADTVVTDLQALSENGPAFLVRNDAWADEYYLLENRQQTKWDASLPNSGLLILYVDYDADVWEWNSANTFGSYYDFNGRQHANDHQRCTIFHADNHAGQYSLSDLRGDVYPYQLNDSLTNTSRPAATLYHPNQRGHLFMDRGITKITRNTDLTMGFSFRVDPKPTPPHPADSTFLLYETFALCNGTGGNDGRWSGNIATSAFEPDNQGWTFNQARGGKECARFGTTQVLGTATTPVFNVVGEATLSFKAAPWGTDGDELLLEVSDGATVEPADFTLTANQWTVCEATIKGNGPVTATFIPVRRLFLDEVFVNSSGLSSISHTPASATRHTQLDVYTTEGRFLGHRLEGLPKGLYIVKATDGNGQTKAVKKFIR